MLALALGCTGTVTIERACPVPEDPCCGLPRCSIQVASGACRHITGPVVELECDRPMATLDQDCANSNGPTSCLVANLRGDHVRGGRRHYLVLRVLTG